LTVRLDHIDLVVFDLDDTLFPERQFVDGGFRAAADYLARRVDVPAEKLLGDMIDLFDANRRGGIFQEMLERNGIDPQSHSQLISELVETYRGHRPMLTLFDDARWALERLRPVRKLAILTDGFVHVQSNKVAALGLEPMVNKIVYTDAWGVEARKPAPDGFMFLQNEFSIAPERCIYIGDNVRKDFVAPNRLGWRTAMVLREGGVYDYDQEAIPPDGEPMWSLRSLDELEI